MLLRHRYQNPKRMDPRRIHFPTESVGGAAVNLVRDVASPTGDHGRFARPSGDHVRAFRSCRPPSELIHGRPGAHKHSEDSSKATPSKPNPRQAQRGVPTVQGSDRRGPRLSIETPRPLQRPRAPSQAILRSINCRPARSRGSCGRPRASSDDPAKREPVGSASPLPRVQSAAVNDVESSPTEQTGQERNLRLPSARSIQVQKTVHHCKILEGPTAGLRVDIVAL